MEAHIYISASSAACAYLACYTSTPEDIQSSTVCQTHLPLSECSQDHTKSGELPGVPKSWCQDPTVTFLKRQENMEIPPTLHPPAKPGHRSEDGGVREYFIHYLQQQ